jgi:hypothetical protein
MSGRLGGWSTSFDLNSSTFYSDSIKEFIRQLEFLRSTTGQPEELEWELRLYNWILAQPDAETKAETYLKLRTKNGFPPVPKRDVVRQLGWSIE